MPEGVEVNIIARQLNSLLKGHYIENISIIDGPYLTNPTDKYKNFRDGLKDFNKKRWCVLDVENKGKFIYFRLLSDESKTENRPIQKYIGNTLGMSGHWRKDKTKHTHFILTTTNPNVQSLYFDDYRHFGTMSLMDFKDLNDKLNELGADILDDNTSFNIFKDALRKKKNEKKSIAEVLMDQKVISGIGNYLRADILYDSRTNPRTQVSSLTDTELMSIYNSAYNISRISLKSNGTTIKTYKDVNMEEGKYNTLIYGKKKDSQGNEVKTYELKKRKVHYVPAIQK